MVRNRKIAPGVSDTAMGDLRRQLDRQAALCDRRGSLFFPSSKTGYRCGSHSPAVMVGIDAWTRPRC